MTRSKADFSLALMRWKYLCIHSNAKYLYFKSVYPPALPLFCTSKVCIHLYCKFVTSKVCIHLYCKFSLQKCVFTCVLNGNRIHQISNVLLSEYAHFPLGDWGMYPPQGLWPFGEYTPKSPRGKYWHIHLENLGYL